MRTNEDWLRDLKANGAAQEKSISDLQSMLLRAVLYVFSRNSGDLGGLAGDERLKLAEDCAQDALIAILNNLEDFRGDSKFTTWAYKFAVNIALMSARHERWKGISLDQLFVAEDGDASEWLTKDESPASAPDQSAMQDDVRAIIREVIERDLTDKQRRVLLLVIFMDVPMDEVVRQLDTNRNAIYKMLHDARRKIKSGLQAHGFEVGEILELFGSRR